MKKKNPEVIKFAKKKRVRELRKKGERNLSLERGRKLPEDRVEVGKFFPPPQILSCEEGLIEEIVSLLRGGELKRSSACLESC